MRGKHTFRILTSLGLVFLMAQTPASAVTLFSDDFETDRITTPDPANTVTWKAPYSAPSNLYGMMFGEGDMYTRSLAHKYSGKYSLRLDFEGRNNFCNSCISGIKTVFMKSGLSNQTYFQDNAGTDHTLNFGTLPDPQIRVYNKSDNWARWQVSSVAVDRLNFVGNSPAQNDMGGDGDFDAGDEIKIVKMCGVSERRHDCDLAINYLENFSAPVHFPYGGTLARRMYFYLPSSTQLPDIGIKLGYVHFKKGGPYAVFPAIMIRSGVSKLEMANGGMYAYDWGGTIKKDTWYYLEEVYTRESASGANDARYQLWLAEAGLPEVLKADETGFNIGSFIDMSIVGNFQNMENATGSIYFDDVAIATSRIGPIEPGGNLPVVPLAPVNNTLN